MTEAVLSLYTSLELLLAEGQTLQRELLAWHSLVTRLLPTWVDGGGLVTEKTDNFLETISQQTALYCSRLLQVMLLSHLMLVFALYLSMYAI